MRIRLLLLSLLAFFALVGSAQASRYHLGLGQAKQETSAFVKEGCERVNACTGFAVGKCFRNTESNASCVGAFFYGYPPEEEVCARLIRWGVNSQGYVAFRGYGPVHCSLVE